MSLETGLRVVDKDHQGTELADIQVVATSVDTYCRP